MIIKNQKIINFHLFTIQSEEIISHGEQKINSIANEIDILQKKKG